MKRLVLAASFCILFATALSSQDRGYEIAKKSDELKEPATMSMIGTMQIFDQSGAVRNRKMVMLTRKDPEGDSSFMEIKEPADVAGTKFLSIPLEGGDTDQRLYLPGLKKVRKIASGGKSGEFVNSDFSYYDLEDHQFDDFTYRLLSEGDVLADETFAGMKFYRVESVPKKSSSPYSRTILWIGMTDFYPYRIETFDKADDSSWKIITITKVEKIREMLVATRTVLENKKRGSRTTLQATDIKVDVALSKDVFSVKGLEK